MGLVLVDGRLRSPLWHLDGDDYDDDDDKGPEVEGSVDSEDEASSFPDGDGTRATAAAGAMVPAARGPVWLPTVPVDTWLVVFGFLRSADFAM